MKYQDITSIIVPILILILALFLLPWSRVNWGTVDLRPVSTLTVSGYADGSVTNDTMTFSVRLTEMNENKDEAISTVNELSREVIEAVKNFGIDESNIKTQNIDVYQYPEDSYDEAMRGKWSVNNNIEIVLTDLSMTEGLTSLLASFNGVNFSSYNSRVGNVQGNADELINLAIENAKEKASTIAQEQGKELGDIISITEGSSSGSGIIPLRAMEGAGGAMPVEPGSSSVSKTVIVVFEIE